MGFGTTANPLLQPGTSRTLESPDPGSAAPPRHWLDRAGNVFKYVAEAHLDTKRSHVSDLHVLETGNMEKVLTRLLDAFRVGVVVGCAAVLVLRGCSGGRWLG